MSGPSGNAVPPAAAVRVPGARVALATPSVYPQSTADAFETAARLGYDGVEVMVWHDPVSQDVNALRRLSDYHEVPILSIHAPCLVISQRVWGTDPWAKLVRSKDAAETLGAETVVVHPPFRWQRDYARQFIGGIQAMADETDVKFAVENMFPLRARGREVTPYSPDWDPTDEDYRHFTLDLSHTSVSQSDALAMGARWATGWPTCTSPTAPGRPATSTSSPDAATSRAPSCSRAWPCRGSTAWSSSRSAPGGPRTAPSARPTSPRRSPSPGSTWPPPREDVSAALRPGSRGPGRRGSGRRTASSQGRSRACPADRQMLGP